VVLGVMIEERRRRSTTIEKLRNSPEIHEMTVKPQLNSRKCLKMCWVFSIEFQTTASVNFRRLPGSISQTPAEFQVD
jgi:hypothetical protein